MKKKKVKVTEFSKLENKVAALWTRVSTEKQERNNCSLENQQRILENTLNVIISLSKRNLAVRMKVQRRKVRCIEK